MAIATYDDKDFFLKSLIRCLVLQEMYVEILFLSVNSNSISWSVDYNSAFSVYNFPGTGVYRDTSKVLGKANSMFISI